MVETVQWIQAKDMTEATSAAVDLNEISDEDEEEKPVIVDDAQNRDSEDSSSSDSEAEALNSNNPFAALAD